MQLCLLLDVGRWWPGHDPNSDRDERRQPMMWSVDASEERRALADHRPWRWLRLCFDAGRGILKTSFPVYFNMVTLDTGY